ncbi:hypothetical protein OIU74_020807 [Salix koriyanagi]|uniref:Uncharacterized protein n=1 Tax=Salix koriyanagi TaxID=2511006 RepID=A0A9Q0P6W5_9ROSI|nr:hypothetical protein OIU74_020807 [Salix koriyanagi]
MKWFKNHMHSYGTFYGDIILEPVNLPHSDAISSHKKEEDFRTRNSVFEFKSYQTTSMVDAATRAPTQCLIRFVPEFKCVDMPPDLPGGYENKCNLPRISCKKTNA